MARRKLQRGFALMDANERHEIAILGGKAAHAMGTAHEWTKDDASKAGAIGGRARKGSKWDRLFNIHPKK